MSETSPLQAPLAVGTMFVQASGNEDIHYVFGVANFRYSSSFNVEIDHYDFDNDVIVYKYTYTTDPTEDSPIVSETLPVFFPKRNVQGALVVPKGVVVINANDSKQKKSGKVKTSTPVVRPVEKDPKPIPGIKGINLAEVSEDEPRWFISQNTVPLEDNSTVEYYVVFIISKTNQLNLRELAYSETDTISCEYDGREDPPENPESIAAVALVDSTLNQFTEVTLGGSTKELNYSDPEPTPFYFSE
ncbi:MAG: hypothetical protein RIC95_03920 [Vicingaceae bacterium]